MKRSSAESGPTSNDTIAVNRKKLKKDEVNQSSDASSAKSLASNSRWTMEELDLNRDIFCLGSFIGDRSQLAEKLFQVVSDEELGRHVPSTLKEMPLSKLKQLLIDELSCRSSTSDELLRTVLGDGRADNGGQDMAGDAIKVEEAKKCEPTPSANTDNKVEEKSTKKVVEIQAVKSREEESSSSSGVDDNNEKCTNEKSNEGDKKKDEEEKQGGWMNLWAKTQMEILELEMRARAIRSLLKKEESENKDKDNDAMKESRQEALIRNESNQSAVGSESKKSDRIAEKSPLFEQHDDGQSDAEEAERDQGEPACGSSKRKLADPATRNYRKANTSNDEILLQHDADSDDSIDRELKSDQP
ncbi:hypothetical protein HDE_13493 [Halotydeus destructor]|nr:hypothetical protein HDE_13493 [Halotydeus destructor]